MDLSNTLRRGITYALYVVPLLSLYVANSLFFPFITGKNFGFRIIVALVFAAWIILLLKDPTARPRKHPVTIAYALFITVMILSTIFSVAPHRSFWSNFERMDGLLNHLHLFAFYLITTSIFTKKNWKIFFGVSIASSVATMGYGLFQLASVFVITQGGVRLDATLGNAIYFGGFLLFNLFLVLYWLGEREERFISKAALVGVGLTFLPIWRSAVDLSSFLPQMSQHGKLNVFLLISLSLVAIVGIGFWALKSQYKDRAAWGISVALLLSYLYFIYQSGSRGIIVGLVFGLGVAFVLGVYQSTGVIKKYLGGALLILIIIAGGFFGIAQTSLRPADGILSRLAFSEITRTFATRTTLWGMGLKAAGEHPVLGWGPETFIMVFSKYYNPDLFTQEPWFDRSHNVFVDWLVHTGVLGFLGYVSLFVAAFYTLYKSLSFSPLQKIALVGVLVGYIAQNVTVFDNLISYIFFYSVLAFIASIDIGKSPQARKAETLPVGFFELATIVVVGLALYGTYFFHIRGVIAAGNLIDGISTQHISARLTDSAQKRIVIENGYKKFLDVIALNNIALSEAREQFVQFTSNVVGDEELAEDLRIRIAGDALKNSEEEAQREALNARSVYYFALMLRRVGQNEEALAAFTRAQERSPKRQLFMLERAVMLNVAGDTDGAITLLEEARNLSEQSFSAIEEMYASLVIEADRIDLLNNIRLPEILLSDRVLSVLLNTNRLELAEKILQETIDTGVAGENRFLQLAEVLFRQGRNSEAIALLEKGKLQLPTSLERFDEAIGIINGEHN
ncbi:MAG: O-antigen ligase family protein [bacterium]|nr:O-antigen ligase family protein [bacterium]